MRPSRSPIILLLLLLVLLGFARTASAQWKTESYPLVAGWNAIWLPLDCSDRTVNDLFNGSAVAEVWQWNASTTGGFTVSPSTPAPADVQWRQWMQGTAGATLSTLTGNTAYLIRVYDGTAPFSLSLTGKPLLPSLPWSNSGVNLVGFPTVSSGAPTFYEFLKRSSALQNNPPIFQYVGGALSSVAPRNPVQVTQPAVTSVARNQAYWIQSNTYTSYYGPVAVTISGQQLLDYGDQVVNLTVQIKNVTDPALGQSLTASLAPAASAAPPAGQTGIAGAVPLLVQSAPNPITGQFTYTPLTSYVTPSLAPGQFVNLVLAVNRSALTGNAGDVSQSLLQITDSLGHTSLHLGVRAVRTSYDGVWVGSATVTKVDEVLSAAQVGAGGNVVTDANGQRVVAVSTHSTTPAAPFSIKLILQANGSGSSLLQQVFIANDANNVPYASAKETPIAAIARAAGTKPGRLTSAFFPPGPQGQPGIYGPGGAIGLSGNVSFQISLGANASTNPFLHLYHPDHDNLNAQFQPIPAGRADAESYQIDRAVTLTFQPTLAGVSDSDPSWGSTTLGGTYLETVKGLRAAANGGGVNVSGTFVVHRISSAATLQP